MIYDSLESVVINQFTLDLKTGEYKEHLIGASKALLDLDTSLEYDVGIDQSNSCSGISVRSVCEDRLVIHEVINNGCSLQTYRRIFQKVLVKFFSNLKIRYFIIEEPIPYFTGHRNKELTSLRHSILDIMPSIKVFKFDTVLPQVWRSGLIPRDCKYSRTSKLATVSTIKKLYPQTEYMHCHEKINGPDYDGFESLGILIGYLTRHGIKEDSTTLKNIGPINTKKNAIAFFIDTEERDKLKEVLETLKRALPKVPQVPKEYDEEHTLYENAKMCLVDDLSVTVVTSEIDNVSISHLFKIRKVYASYCMIILHATLLDKVAPYLADYDLNIEVFY